MRPTDRGDETTLLDSGHRFLLPPHCNVFVVDGLYVDDLTLSLEYGKPKDDSHCQAVPVGHDIVDDMHVELSRLNDYFQSKLSLFQRIVSLKSDSWLKLH